MRLIRATREEKRMFEKNFIACDWIKSFFFSIPTCLNAIGKYFDMLFSAPGENVAWISHFFFFFFFCLNMKPERNVKRRTAGKVSFFLCYFINFTMRQKLVSFQLSGIQVRNKLRIEEIIEYKEWVCDTVWYWWLNDEMLILFDQAIF